MIQTQDELQTMYTLHVASHLVKARSLVLKHNTRLRDAAAKAKAAAAAKRLERALAAEASNGDGKQPARKKRRRKRSGSNAIPTAEELDSVGIKKLGDADGAGLLGSAEDEEPEYKDQGFTRPRVLVLLPFRSSCHKFVSRLLTLLPVKEVHNRKRFDDQFGPPVDVNSLMPEVPVDPAAAKKKKKERKAVPRPHDYERMFQDNSDGALGRREVWKCMQPHACVGACFRMLQSGCQLDAKGAFALWLCSGAC